MGEIRAASYHQGINRAGKESLYSLELADESDGTRRSRWWVWPVR